VAQEHMLFDFQV